MAKRSQSRESEGLNSIICLVIDRCVTLEILPICSGLLGKSALLFHSWYENQMKCFGKQKFFWYHNYLFVIQNFIISKQCTPSLLYTKSQTTYLVHTSQHFPSQDVFLLHAWEHQSIPCSKQRLTGKVPHWFQLENSCHQTVRERDDHIAPLKREKRQKCHLDYR